MRIKSIPFSIALILLITLAGCDFGQPDSRLANVDGIDVLVKDGIAQEMIEMSEADFIAMGETLPVSRSIKDSAVEISFEELVARVETVSKEYGFPEIEKFLELDPSALALARKDFPSLTDSEISEKRFQLADIYSRQLRWALFQDIKSYPIGTSPGSASSKGTSAGGGEYPGGLNGQEFWLCVANPFMISGTLSAATNAKNWAQSMYPGWACYQDKADAMRHSCWNALICCYVPGTKSWKMDWAKKFTDAHEYGSPEAPDLRDRPMDLHNNAEGRTFFDMNSSQNWIGWVTNPSDATVMDGLYQKSRNASFFTDPVQVLTLVGQLVYYVER